MGKLSIALGMVLALVAAIVWGSLRHKEPPLLPLSSMPPVKVTSTDPDLPWKPDQEEARRREIEAKLALYLKHPSDMELARQIAAYRKDAVKLILIQLGWDDGQTHFEALKKILMLIPAVESAPLLIAELGDDKKPPAYVKRIIEFLGELGKQAKAEARVRDFNGPIRAAIPALLVIFRNSESVVLKTAAVVTLGDIGDHPTARQLVPGLSSAALRREVLDALGKLGNLDTVPDILNLARPGAVPFEEEVRIHAALLAMGPEVLPQLLAELARTLAEPVEPGGGASGWKNRQRGLFEKIPPGEKWGKKLFEQFRDREDLRGAVLEVLKWRSLDHELAFRILPFYARVPPGLRLVFAQAVSGSGDPRGAPFLVSLLKVEGQNAEIAQAAIEGLGRVGDPSAKEVLRHFEKDAHLAPFVRSALSSIERRHPPP